MGNYYIVLTNKKDAWDRIIARRMTTLSEINAQAEWVWSLFKPKERYKYRILVQGEIGEGDKFFDSDNLS